MAKVSFMKDDPYSDIRGYATRFRDLLVNMGHGIDPSIPDENETLAVIMDQGSLNKLFALSPTIAAIIGVHNQKLTVALLAVDPNTREVLAEHTSGGVDGQQVWPYVVPVDNLSTFLP